MGPDSTSDAYVVKFLNNVVIGAPVAHAKATALTPKVVTGPDNAVP